MADKKQSKKKTEQEKNWYGPVPGISIEAQGPCFYFGHSGYTGRSVLFPAVSFYLFYNAGTNRSFP